MAETPEMESPSVRQDCLVEAQEDSTSVEPEPGSVLSPSETTPTTAATPPAADDVAEDERRSVTRNSCENLVMVCERLDEKPNDEGRSEDEQSSDYSHVLKQEEGKEVDMNVKLEKEDEGDSTEEPLQPEELSKVNSEDAKTEITANVSRKRPAGSDFLPIGAEIKRIGVEISEEEATQRRNDVRRLSPVLVSQRERTLGEVSLTAESCLFGMDGTTGNDVPEISLSPQNDSEIKDVTVEKETLGRIDAGSPSTECASSNNEDISDRAIGKVNYDSEEEILGAASSSRCNGFDGTAKPHSDDVADASGEIASCVLTDNIEAMSPAALSSPTCRRLMVVLNRCEVDLTKKEIENLGKSACDRIAEKNSSESRSSAEEECNLQVKESPKKQRWQGDICTPTARSKRSELMENLQSPDSSPVLKNCTVVLERISEVRQAHSESGEEDTSISKKIEKESAAPVAVIGKLEEDEEVVLTSSSPANENIAHTSHELDSTETMPSSPEETQEAPPVDVAEAVDTETETETGSDSSEVSLSIAGIRELRDVDVASSELPCSEAERGELCCVEVAMAPIMTRLEAERPEPYTEDSAESLALATGARDEVRSDGSDSGLGNELAGDPGPAPAPESDSETSFLDRLPDDILSDKEKSVNQLDSFATSSGTSGTPGQPPLTSFRTLPAKSNLKRRLTDCMESDESRGNVDEPVKKKRNIQFDAVTVYYFPRAQGFTCVPSQGGSTLGMSATHTHAERFSLSEHAAEQRRIHRARLAQLRSERSCATNCVTSETASSSEDPSDDTDEEPSDNEELDIDSYYFLQPVPTWQRRALLRAAGVRRIDAVEKDECRDIRASREHCGCGCKGYCDPESCPCSRANVKCQVDRPGFPCGCTRDGCANNSGRIEFNPVRVRTHFIHTLMRLELEKKQREEEGGSEHDRVTDNQGQGGGRGGGPLREIGPLGSVMDTGGGDACALPGAGPGGGGGGGGFTTLHYETGHDGGVVTAGCQPEVPGTREDSLDLYAIRDDCYASEDAVDGSQSVAGVQRKLHPEFSQTFQSFSQSGGGGGGAGSAGGGGGGGMSFQQSSYQDYGSPYASLPSTSRVPQFQPAQFQSPNNPAAFAHYGPYGGGQDAANACAAQAHQSQQPPQQQHPSYESTVFAQEEVASAAQYTNLTNSVQPMSASVVQQMQQGKLEPFSELLSGRYSYYGEMHEPQPQQQQQPQPQQQQHHHGTYGGHGGHGAVGKVVEMVEPVQVTGEQQSEATAEDCDENFGEIIKKSMVETVSA